MSILRRIHGLGHGGQRRAVWEEFSRDQRLIETYNIKPDEMDALKRVALMGNVLSKEDFIFVLSAIRGSSHR
jgi:hypothetical protein